MSSLELIPPANAALNLMSAVCISFGLYFIKRGQRENHRRCMVAAFGLSVLFLVLYVIRYALTGPTPYTGPARPLYFFILWTHTPLGCGHAHLGAHNAPACAARGLRSAQKDRPHYLPHLALRLGDGTAHLWDAALCPLIFISGHKIHGDAREKTTKQCGLSPRFQIIAPPLAWEGRHREENRFPAWGGTEMLLD
jgi:hypothetical protein